MEKKYNVVVVGGGAAGLVSAYLAASAKAQVALVCDGPMGGDCLNTGCVPSKALIRSAKFAAEIKKYTDLGFQPLSSSPDFKKIMERVRAKIKKIEPHDSRERYTELGVDCYDNKVTRITKYGVFLDDKRELKGNNIIVATGARPAIPKIKGLDQVNYFTSDTIWDLTELPRKLVVIGAGPVGCEMAQAFARLGSEVMLIEKNEHLFNDEDISDTMTLKLQSEGVTVWKKTSVDHIEPGLIAIEENGYIISQFYSHIFVSVGRTPNTDLAEGSINGLTKNPDGSLHVNKYLQANGSNIYACGDVLGHFQLTHAASYEASHCIMNALGRPFVRKAIDYSVVPSVVYTDPEIARVGITQTQLIENKIDFNTYKYDIKNLDRAVVDDEDSGFVKVFIKEGSDQILGVVIVSHAAGEMIAEWALAMKNNLGIGKILDSVHAYPTMAEASQRVAGDWKRSSTSETLLGVAEKINRWRL